MLIFTLHQFQNITFSYVLSIKYPPYTKIYQALKYIFTALLKDKAPKRCIPAAFAILKTVVTGMFRIEN